MIQFQIGRTVLAAYHCGSKLLILSQNTTSLPVPFPFFEAEGFLPVTIFEGEGAPPFAFFEGWDDGWSSAVHALRIVEAWASPLCRVYVEERPFRAA